MNQTEIIETMKNVSKTFLKYDNVEYEVIKNKKGEIVKLIEVVEN